MFLEDRSNKQSFLRCLRSSLFALEILKPHLPLQDLNRIFRIQVQVASTQHNRILPSSSFEKH